MQLTPLIKLFVIASAFAVNMALLIWLGIKTDALGIGLNEHVYNIVFTVITVLNGGVTGLLAYMGLKAPVIGEEVRDVEE